VEAIALASNAAVLAGRVTDRQGKSTGFLTVLSAADGKRLADIALAAPPTFDGLAIAYGRVFVSLADGSLVCFGKTD
jgi:hypothetical protein